MEVATIWNCDFCGFENSANNIRCGGCGNHLELPMGRILDNRFKIVEKIGAGGMGRIYKAEDNQFPGSFVALKEMAVTQENFSDKQSRIEKFTKEAQLLHEINYRGIPRVLSYFIENEKYYLVMEYVDGKDLRKIKADNPQYFTQEKIIEISIKILEILQFLHSRGVIHSDIKPENIMIDDNDDVYIVDFGITSLIMPNGHVSKMTRKMTVFYTPFFSAPEIIIERKILAQSDIYSLGAIILWLITSRDDSMPSVIGEARSLKNQQRISDAFYKIIVKATEYDYDKRFVSAKEMREALEKNKNQLGAMDISNNDWQEIVQGPSSDELKELGEEAQKLFFQAENIFDQCRNGDEGSELLNLFLNKVGDILQNAEQKQIIFYKLFFNLIDWENFQDKDRKVLESLINRAVADKNKKFKFIFDLIIKDSHESFFIREFVLNNLCKENYLFYSWKELIDFYLSLPAEDLFKQKIISTIQKKINFEIGSGYGEFIEIKKNDIKDEFSLFMDDIKNRGDYSLKKMCLEIIIARIYNVFITCSWVMFDARNRRYALNYLENLLFFAKEEKIFFINKLSKIFESERIIGLFELARGWDALAMISALGLPFVLGSHEEYKKQYYQRFKQLKNDFLSLLDSQMPYLSEVQIKELKIFMRKIEKIK